MGSEVGVGYISLVASGKGLVSGIQKEMAGVAGITGAAGQKAGGRFSNSFTRSMSGLAASVGKLGLMAAAGGVFALGAGLIAGGVAGMKFNSSIEQTTIAMGTMLGSTSKAKTLIGEVTKMAAATPFEFPELADATKRLVAYGVSAGDAVPLMTRLGDISSALNIPIGEMSDLYGKMKVSGKITMEDMNEMAGRGIPIYGALAKTLGVGEGEIRKLVEGGKVGFPQIEAAIVGMTDKGSMFGGMMDKQSLSFSGLWSTIKDGFTQVFAGAVKPLFEWLTSTAMPAVVAALPQIQAVVGQVMGKVGGFITDVVGKVQEVIAGFKSGGLSGALAAIFPPAAVTAITIGVGLVTVAIAGLVDVFGFFAAHGELTKVLLATLAAGFVAFGVVSAVLWLASAAVAAFGAVLAFIVSPIGIIVLAVAALAAAAYLIYTNWEPIAAFFTGIWQSMGAGQAVVVALVAGITAFGIAAGIAAIPSAYMTVALSAMYAAEWIVATATSIATGAMTAFGAVLAFVTSPIGIIVLAVAALAAAAYLIYTNWGPITEFFTNLWETVQTVTGAALAWVLGIFGSLPGSVKSALAPLLAIITGPFRAGYVGVKAIIDIVKAVVRGDFGAIPGIIKGALSSLASIMLSPFTAGYNLVRGLVTRIPGMIAGALGGLGNLLFSSGKAILQGLWAGMTSKWASVLSWAKSIASKLSGAVRKVLGIDSPSKVMAEVGKNIMLGLGKGMQAQIPGVLDIASGLAGSISGTMGGVVGPSVRSGAARGAPTMSGMGGSGAQSVTVPQMAPNIAIHVSGVGNPEQVAERVYQKLRSRRLSPVGV